VLLRTLAGGVLFKPWYTGEVRYNVTEKIKKRGEFPPEVLGRGEFPPEVLGLIFVVYFVKTLYLVLLIVLA